LPIVRPDAQTAERPGSTVPGEDGAEAGAVGLALVPAPAAFEETGLARALHRIARGDRRDFDALLHDVELHAVIDGTRVTCHCHSIRVDGVGRPRVADLVDAICESVVEFAIPRRDIERAKARDAQTGTTREVMRLGNMARGLFSHLTNSGEGGELLLFVLAEMVLKLPQVMCKMSLKTNTQMHVHGVDGVHAGVDEATGRLALYWGEAKIYHDPAAAIRECLASLAPVLIGTGPAGAATRDLQLLQGAMNVTDPALEEALKQFLNPRHPSYNDLEFRGLCLVGFNSDAYPSIGAQHEAIIEAVTAQLPAWKAQIKRRVSAEQLGPFALHIFCVPFPDVDDFRTHLRRFLGIASAAA
jgi:hypothetical protein